MKVIREGCDEKIYNSHLWEHYFGNLRVGVLDIETTGLSAAGSSFVLGCLYDVAGERLFQVLAQNRREEKEALIEYLDLVSQMDVLITYNGRHFDIPFLVKRAERVLGISNLELPYDLDLHQLINGHSPIKKLVPNLKQKTVENYMGFWNTRADEISGKESIELYYSYESTGDEDAERKILLHNNDDVRQLARLTKVISKSDFHKAMMHMGFPVHLNSPGGKSVRLVTSKPRLHRNSLMIYGSQKGDAMDYRGFAIGDYPAESKFSSQDKSFCIKLPVIRQSDYAIVDILAAGLDDSSFTKLPNYSDGFLVIAHRDSLYPMETNFFIKEYITKFIGEEF